MKRKRMRKPLALALVLAFALLGMLFLFAAGIDALEDRSDFQFFADSSTYHAAAAGGLAHIENMSDLIGLAANFLGPLFVLTLAGENYYAVLVLNALLLAFSVVSLARSLQLDAVRLLLVLLANPMTISSLLSVNKEIISLVFVALLVRAYAAGSLGALLLAAVASVLVRWQLTMMLLVTCMIVGSANPLRHHPRTTLFILLACLSVLYVQLATTLAPIRINFEDAAESYEGSGFYEALISLQDAGWYWAIFPAKAAHLLFGMGLRLDRLFNPTNVYNDVWQLLHSTALLVLFVVLLRRKRFSFSNDLVYLSFIYVAVFAITPIYAPRYFYPVYILWAAALCTTDPRSRIFVARKPQRRSRAARITQRIPIPIS
jgi:hypothetical protein